MFVDDEEGDARNLLAINTRDGMGYCVQWGHGEERNKSVSRNRLCAFYHVDCKAN